ncbi:MAG: beta-phosphoglucomutase [Sphaerochaetaceae bacterium]
MIDTVIFDLDGVICSTDLYHTRAWSALCEKKGYDFPEEVQNRLKGISRKASYQKILDYNGVKETSKQILISTDWKNNYYKKLLSKMNKNSLEKKVKDTLLELKEKKYLLAVASSSRNAEFILEQIGLKGFFDTVVTGNMITQTKPNPEIFLKAAAILGKESKYCLVVEDAESGVEAALRAGMKAIAFNQDKINFKSKDIKKQIILK